MNMISSGRGRNKMKIMNKQSLLLKCSYCEKFYSLFLEFGERSRRYEGDTHTCPHCGYRVGIIFKHTVKGE